MTYYEKCRRENNGDVSDQQYLDWLEPKLKPTITMKYDKPVEHSYDCVRLFAGGGDWRWLTTVECLKCFTELDVEEINYIYGN